MIFISWFLFKILQQLERLETPVVEDSIGQNEKHKKSEKKKNKINVLFSALNCWNCNNTVSNIFLFLERECYYLYSECATIEMHWNIQFTHSFCNFIASKITHLLWLFTIKWYNKHTHHANNVHASQFSFFYHLINLCVWAWTNYLLERAKTEEKEEESWQKKKIKDENIFCSMHVFRSRLNSKAEKRIHTEYKWKLRIRIFECNLEWLKRCVR